MLQAKLLRPYTEKFFRMAGLATGMRVLDVGSGMGDVALLTAEIVGLVPREALDENAEYFSRLENFSKTRILENQIAKCSEG